MTEPNNLPQVVYVKYESSDGSLEIAGHTRPALLTPHEQLDDFVREIVQDYKTNPQIKYLGLADDEEYTAFQKIQPALV